MDNKSKDNPSPTHRPTDDSTSHDATHTLPPYSDHPNHKARRPSQRPGEDLMSSGDPSTAALRAWAADKQMHTPGSDGSFYLGPLSMGVGAVSGGPMGLPRKEFIVEPPMHEVDQRMGEEVRRLAAEEQEGGEKKRRGSVRGFFGRLGKGKEKEESRGEVEEGPISREN